MGPRGRQYDLPGPRGSAALPGPATDVLAPLLGGGEPRKQLPKLKAVLSKIVHAYTEEAGENIGAGEGDKARMVPFLRSVRAILKVEGPGSTLGKLFGFLSVVEALLQEAPSREWDPPNTGGGDDDSSSAIPLLVRSITQGITADAERVLQWLESNGQRELSLEDFYSGLRENMLAGPPSSARELDGLAAPVNDAERRPSAADRRLHALRTLSMHSRHSVTRARDALEEETYGTSHGETEYAASLEIPRGLPSAGDAMDEEDSSDLKQAFTDDAAGMLEAAIAEQREHRIEDEASNISDPAAGSELWGSSAGRPSARLGDAADGSEELSDEVQRIAEVLRKHSGSDRSSGSKAQHATEAPRRQSGSSDSLGSRVHDTAEALHMGDEEDRPVQGANRLHASNTTERF